MDQKQRKTYYIDLGTLFEIIRDVVASLTLAKYIYGFLKYARTHLQLLYSLELINSGIRHARIFDLFLNLETVASCKDYRIEVERVISLFGIIRYHVKKNMNDAELILGIEGKRIHRFSLTRFRFSSCAPIHYMFDFLDNWRPNYPLPIENIGVSFED
jgi:hypothetical protein